MGRTIILTEQQFTKYKQMLSEEMSFNDITAEAETASKSPTEGQKEAGNYKMGHVNIKGFKISIENAKGSVRTYKDKNGKEGKNIMKHHYGYFLNTKGKDGDHIDVFIGKFLNFDKIFVVDQNNEQGEFDESKVMLGFQSKESAKKAYLSNFDPDWKGFREITEIDIPTFKTWLYDGYKQRKPFSEYADIKKKSNK